MLHREMHTDRNRNDGASVGMRGFNAAVPL